MENNKGIAHLTAGGGESVIICRNSQGAEVRASLLRLTRYTAVFEVYNPYSILQLSEALTDFKIIMNEQLIYSGRAIVSNLVNTGIMLSCEVGLDDSWLDVDLFSPLREPDRLKTEFSAFLEEWKKIYQITPDFKLVVADMHTLLVDLRRWLEQVELGVRSQPSIDRLQLEKDVIHELLEPIFPSVSPLLEKFEETARAIPREFQSAHRIYIKRFLHPVVLCSPFIHRTFQKPLGYAGDYEMVNMMLREPCEGGSMFAKILNVFFLRTAPVRAHQNRITYLVQQLVQEVGRIAKSGRVAKILNLGCGPAREIQDFLIQEDLCERAEFTLLDFNEETLKHVNIILEDIKMRYRRMTRIEYVRKSVHQILKESAQVRKNPQVAPTKQYDFIYCAGLFDYLQDRVCKQLLAYFFHILAPGGTLLATNVDDSNPNKGWMEYVLEWHLVYRNTQQLASLRPDGVDKENFHVKSDPTGVNIFIEIRKPEIKHDSRDNS